MHPTSRVYHHKVMGRSYPCIQIITIKEILKEGKRLDVPLSLAVLRAAEKKASGEQLSIFTNNLVDAEVS